MYCDTRLGGGTEDPVIKRKLEYSRRDRSQNGKDVPRYQFCPRNPGPYLRERLAMLAAMLRESCSMRSRNAMNSPMVAFSGVMVVNVRCGGWLACFYVGISSRFKAGLT